MSLENYLARSHEPYVEMWLDFDREQVQQLFDRVKETGYHQYIAFVREHLGDILKYISLSPSQRHQKKWLNHPDNLLIRLAALQISASTNELLRDIQGINQIVNRGSYRQFHSIVATGLANRLVVSSFVRFPFQDLGFENPFFVD